MRTTILATVICGLFLGGCYAPDGGLMPASNGTFTYYSTTDSPKTISIIDVRTEESFFAMELPVGRQLTFKFLHGGGSDKITAPDRMQWEVYPLGTKTGRLTNQMTVPPPSARRIQVALRPAPEWPTPDERAPLLIDKDAELPGYWSPKGGKIPASIPVYDQ